MLRIGEDGKLNEGRRSIDIKNMSVFDSLPLGMHHLGTSALLMAHVLIMQSP